MAQLVDLFNASAAGVGPFVDISERIHKSVVVNPINASDSLQLYVSNDDAADVVDEAQTIPSTPFKVTIAAGANQFLSDVQVKFTVSGVRLTKIASGTPTTGQYVVDNGGTYTFAAADTTLAVKISYKKIANLFAYGAALTAAAVKDVVERVRWIKAVKTGANGSCIARLLLGDG